MADFTRFPEAFQKAGIKYTEEPGWRDRGHGDIVQFQFIVVHHTAGGGDAGDIRVVRDGTSSLRGPLSQIVFKRDGTPHIVAAGVCWHAGYGPAMWGAPAGNGNYYSVGIEGVSNGYNDWTEAQRREYPRVVAAILKEAGLPADRWIFHRDYNKRDGKIDPAGFDAGWFNNEVIRHYNSIGSTPPPPAKTAIEGKRDENPWLGNKVFEEKERTSPDGVGKYALYENGAIYFTVPTGARVLSNEMMEKWGGTGYEMGFLGYPVSDVFDLPKKEDGRAAHFQKGSIYWSEKYGARILNGVIKSKWDEMDYERSFLGMPKSDEILLPDGVGVLQDFHGGIMYYSPATGANSITGLILEAYRRNEYERGCGYPKGGEIKCPVKDGVFQIFEFSHGYYQHGQEKAFFVPNDFLDYYGRMGYESGRFGFPITDAYHVKDDVFRQDFEAGSIEINRKDKSAILIVNGEKVSV